jgi:hypothetical protein
MHAEPPRKPPPATPKVLFLNFVLTAAMETLFPRLRRRLDWITRVGPRGFAIHAGLHTAILMGMDWLMRWFAESGRKRAELEERLRRELGRAPWPEEIERAWMEEHGIDLPGDAYWDLR